MQFLFVFYFFIYSNFVWAQGLSIASWNIERLGHGSNKNYESLGIVGSHFDFIAIQEAMTVQGLELLKNALEQATRSSWDMMYSHPIGRGSYKEKYAFIWREESVAYESGAVVYLDRYDLYAREPYSARFIDLTTGEPFVAATVHIVFGRSVGDRTPEINELAEYWSWLHETYDDTPVLLLGDFNLPPTHAAWQPLLDRGAIPLITQGATTLSSIDGRYANLYDNVFIDESNTIGVSSSGILRFPELLGWTHEQARAYVSDHAPVFVLTHGAGLHLIEEVSITPQPSPGEKRVLREGPIIGNRNSMIAHRPDCPSYDAVAERNRVPFSTLSEALESGFRLAENCP